MKFGDHRPPRLHPALNAEANGVAVSFTDAPLLDSPAPAANAILAGDIAYEGPMAERVHAWLRRAHADGARVLVGDPRRTYFDPTGLVRLAEYEAPTTRELENRESSARACGRSGRPYRPSRRGPSRSSVRWSRIWPRASVAT